MGRRGFVGGMEPAEAPPISSNTRRLSASRCLQREELLLALPAARATKQRPGLGCRRLPGRSRKPAGLNLSLRSSVTLAVPESVPCRLLLTCITCRNLTTLLGSHYLQD